MPASGTKKLPNEPIMIVTLAGSADLSSSQFLSVETRTILDEASESLFLIIDLSDAQLTFGDVVVRSSRAARGDNPIFQHPNIRQILQVTSDPMLELSAKGLDSEVFGNIQMRVFNTLADALAYARAAQ